MRRRARSTTALILPWVELRSGLESAGTVLFLLVFCRCENTPGEELSNAFGVILGVLAGSCRDGRSRLGNLIMTCHDHIREHSMLESRTGCTKRYSNVVLPVFAGPNADAQAVNALLYPFCMILLTPFPNHAADLAHNSDHFAQNKLLSNSANSLGKQSTPCRCVAAPRRVSTSVRCEERVAQPQKRHSQKAKENA